MHELNAGGYAKLLKYGVHVTFDGILRDAELVGYLGIGKSGICESCNLALTRSKLPQVKKLISKAKLIVGCCVGDRS